MAFLPAPDPQGMRAERLQVKASDYFHSKDEFAMILSIFNVDRYELMLNIFNDYTMGLCILV